MANHENLEIQNYFNILCKGNYPEFIDKYIETEELQRLKGIGQFCGVDYNKIPLLNTKYWYSRLDHSIACAYITWHLTKDKTQTIAALFHDIGTPAFSHSVDFMLNDSENQSSSEKEIIDMISNMEKLQEILFVDEINITDIFDIEKYTLVENKKPKICVDRLEGILSTGLVWRQFWNLEDIRKIYNSVIVGVNEENEQEITFNDVEMADMFMFGVREYAISLQSGEDKLSLNFMGSILFKAIKSNVFKQEELYIKSEEEIIKLIEKSKNTVLKDMWNKFKELEVVNKTEHFIEDKYCISVEAKKRYAIPLVKTGDEFKRLVDISEKAKTIINDYLSYKDSKFVSLDVNYEI